jgi:hypothetical protein
MSVQTPTRHAAHSINAPDSRETGTPSPPASRTFLNLGMDHGGSISGNALVYRPALRSSRGPLAVASQCKAYGPGLEAMAIARQSASFTIESFDATGTRLQSGGEPFRVDCRGASVVRARVTDKEDGTYSVAWTPSVSGPYDIAISLHGIPLPHSPWKISVLMPRPDASKCVLKGDALSKAVAREPAAFGKRARMRFVRAELLARRIPLSSSLFPLPSSMHVFPRPGEPHPRAHASSAHAAALRFFFLCRGHSFPLAACLLLAPTPCLFALPVRLAFSPLLARAQR